MHCLLPRQGNDPRNASMKMQPCRIDWTAGLPGTPATRSWLAKTDFTWPWQAAWLRVSSRQFCTYLRYAVGFKQFVQRLSRSSSRPCQPFEVGVRMVLVGGWVPCLGGDVGAATFVFTLLYYPFCPCLRSFARHLQRCIHPHFRSQRCRCLQAMPLLPRRLSRNCMPMVSRSLVKDKLSVVTSQSLRPARTLLS